MSNKPNIAAWVFTIAAISAGVWLWRKNRSSSLPSLIINKDGKVMKNYFGDKEFTQSSVAKRYGLVNEPDEAQWYRLHQLRDNILNPARERLGYPIYITSGFRTNYLNQLVGGASNSQHITGEAVDITTRDRDMNRTLFAILTELNNFDQLIWEKGGEWIHVSFRENGGRGQMLAYDGNIYTNINNNWQNAIA